MASHVHIGISGWRYAGWRGVFYPPGLVQARELEFASRAVQTIEINGSHYALQTPASYEHWHDATPEKFVFSVKSPRYITHMLRLEGEAMGPAMANFFGSGLFKLRAKLGPILWQFPPSMPFKPEVFEAFLRGLPRDTAAAADIAAGHDRKLKHACLTPDRKRRMRHAIEIRHASFCDAAFVRLLRRYGVALVISDSVMPWPYAEDLTAGFVYLRLHGPDRLYGGQYSDEALDRWAQRMDTWAGGGEPDDAQRLSPLLPRRRASRDVYCYFDNDQKVRAPFDARRLMARLDPTALSRSVAA
jgi:uncharacterized protein YecE (DUF72 family)